MRIQIQTWRCLIAFQPISRQLLHIYKVLRWLSPLKKVKLLHLSVINVGTTKLFFFAVFYARRSSSVVLFPLTTNHSSRSDPLNICIGPECLERVRQTSAFLVSWLMCVRVCVNYVSAAAALHIVKTIDYRFVLMNVGLVGPVTYFGRLWYRCHLSYICYYCI